MLSHQFLVNGPYSKGAWVPPADLARKIINAAEEHDEAYLIALDEPDIILYANDDDEGYRLTLGVAHDGDQPEIPTWAEWLDRQGIDPNDVDAVAEHAI